MGDKDKKIKIKKIKKTHNSRMDSRMIFKLQTFVPCSKAHAFPKFHKD